MANSQWWELWVIGEPALDELLSWQLQLMGAQGSASQLKAGQLQISGYFPQTQVSEADLTEMSTNDCRQ
ncbi:MAG: hypothetical protein HC852_17755, partial [Acaryochloridaceae cyanobacterium RU_4_10]|nr:hypothetical protein [Acaryochloridaceae cyanobacterium RU_4_10]